MFTIIVSSCSFLANVYACMDVTAVGSRDLIWQNGVQKSLKTTAIGL